MSFVTIPFIFGIFKKNLSETSLRIFITMNKVLGKQENLLKLLGIFKTMDMGKVFLGS
jgi:hypothetical protein